MNPIDRYTAQCPYCGEQIELTIDASVARQGYIEDCQVCCRPMNVSVSVDNSEINIVLLREDD